MTHLHVKTGKTYEVAIMDDFDGSTFDMCVITKWDPNFNESPTLVDYYFGATVPPRLVSRLVLL